MKKNRQRLSRINWVGVISFFVLIAFVMQMAILCYDFIREKTSNVSLIAVLILIEIIILSTFCRFLMFFWLLFCSYYTKTAKTSVKKRRKNAFLSIFLLFFGQPAQKAPQNPRRNAKFFRSF